MRLPHLPSLNSTLWTTSANTGRYTGPKLSIKYVCLALRKLTPKSRLMRRLIRSTRWATTSSPIGRSRRWMDSLRSPKQTSQEFKVQSFQKSHSKTLRVRSKRKLARVSILWTGSHKGALIRFRTWEPVVLLVTGPSQPLLLWLVNGVSKTRLFICYPLSNSLTVTLVAPAVMAAVATPQLVFWTCFKRTTKINTPCRPQPTHTKRRRELVNTPQHLQPQSKRMEVMQLRLTQSTIPQQLYKAMYYQL